jgi:hypothetical protein
MPQAGHKRGVFRIKINRIKFVFEPIQNLQNGIKNNGTDYGSNHGARQCS